MRRTITLALITLTAVMSYGLYNMKYEVRRLEFRLSEVNADLAADHEALRVLRAEWAYLNRPDRLQELAARHLKLTPLSYDQVTSLAALPDVQPAVEKIGFVKPGQSAAQ